MSLPQLSLHACLVSFPCLYFWHTLMGLGLDTRAGGLRAVTFNQTAVNASI